MGKGKTQTQNVDQRQTADTTFNNQQWLNNLAQFQQQQQQQTAQQQQQQTAQQQTVQGQTAQTGMQQQATQQQTGVDAASQAYIDQLRQHALGGLGSIGAPNFAPQAGDINALTGELMNPYLNQVVGGVGQEFDRLRAQAAQQTDQQATAAGAFGGSRHGVAAGQRAAELDRAQTQQVGQLLAGGHQQAQAAALPLAGQQAMAPAQALAAQQALLAGGMGPTGTTTTGTGTTTSQQQQQQQQVMNALSQLFGSNLGFTSGTSSGTQQSSQLGGQFGNQQQTGTMTGTTKTKEDGNLWGDLLGLGLSAGGMFLGGGNK